jgi:hypothetical protein
MIKGNNQRYNLLYKNKKFNERYAYNSNNDAVHVLKLDTKPDSLTFTFDNTLIHFASLDRDSYNVKNIIKIKRSQIIVVDDNFDDKNRFIRILYDARYNLEMHDGFYDQITFKNKGLYELNISDSMCAWYNIKIEVD